MGTVLNQAKEALRTYEQVKELAQLYNIPISSKEFHCPGEFVGMNTGRPNNNDIENIKKFTHNFI